MNEIQLRKFDRETLQRLAQVLGHMHMEVHTAPSIFGGDPGDLYVHVYGQRDLQVRIGPGKQSKSGKDGMLLRVFGMGQAKASTVFHTKNPGDYVPAIVKTLCGLMARAYAVELHRAELEEEIDNAE